MGRPVPAPEWVTVPVGDATLQVMTAGRGDPLLFLPGWGLTPRTYAGGIVRLCASGVRVIAPTLPGLGPSTGLALRDISLRGYAERIADLLDTMDVEKPLFTVGHSLGGGIALRLAGQRPDLVRSLTLIDPVGGVPGPGRRGVLRDGSWLRWALGAVAELDPRDVLHLAPGLLREVVPVVARRPVTATLAAAAALRASLADEAQRLIDASVPVIFVWGDRDRLVTPGELGAVTTSLPTQVVRGRHGWLLSDPATFAELLQNALTVHAMLERQRRRQPVTLPPGLTLADLFPDERRHRARWDRLENGAAGGDDAAGNAKASRPG
jgi:pimeloyl-ACP methyl ester carboxylesterase